MLLPAWFSSFSMDFRSHLRLFQCRDILLPAQFSSFPCGFRNILGPFQCRGVLSPTCPPLSMLGHVHAARRSSIPPFQCRNILIAAIACPDIERGRCGYLCTRFFVISRRTRFFKMHSCTQLRPNCDRLNVHPRY